jgi:succinyl-diaminopimelate desuccinylase
MGPRDLALRAAAAVDPDEVVRTARALVRIDSVHRPGVGAEGPCAEWLAARLSERGLRVTLEDAAPGRPNVIADWAGGGRPGRARRRLLFEGHTDVVTEGRREDWTRDPFGGEIEGGRLYGRGACDTKGGLAAAVCALDAVRRAAPDLDGDVRLACLADEEGLMLGVKRFIERGWARGVDGAIVCEPEENEVCLVQKGAIRVVADFTGRMAHGAMPYAGANPIPAAADFVLRVGALDAQTRARHGRHEFLGLPHITPTIVAAPAAGEPQINVMPGAARVALDVRTIPGQDHREIEAALTRLAAEAAAPHAGVSARVAVIEERPVTETPPDAPIVRAVEAACRVALSREPRRGGVPGATDGTFLAAWAGVPIVTIGPGMRTVPHQADEWVGIGEMVDAARLYAAAAVLFLTEGFE